MSSILIITNSMAATYTYHHAYETVERVVQAAANEVGVTGAPTTQQANAVVRIAHKALMHIANA